MVPPAYGEIWTQALRTVSGFSMSNGDTQDTATGGAPHNGRSGTGQPDTELAQRMQRLSSKLDAVHAAEAKKVEAEAARRAPGGPSALGRAFRLSAEFIAGVGAGGLIGWSIDHVAGSSPWGMIVFLMLGFLTGIYNVMRATGQLTPQSEHSDRGAK